MPTRKMPNSDQPAKMIHLVSSIVSFVYPFAIRCTVPVATPNCAAIF
jgi:hypothetical protein